MTLRVLLVGLVVCLGLDLPGAVEVAAWQRSGQNWINARMADLSSLRVEAERALVGTPDRSSGEVVSTDPTAEVVSGRVDLAFEVVMEGMVAGFAADLASERSKPLVEEVLADAEAESEPSTAANLGELTAEPASTVDRISKAVRLTRQAIGAWTSVIQSSDDQVIPSDQVDSF